MAKLWLFAAAVATGKPFYAFLIGLAASVGAGVVIGSNVFNLAALLGLSAVVAGRIAFPRRVVLLAGIVWFVWTHWKHRTGVETA